jgi:hypothetical protein
MSERQFVSKRDLPRRVLFNMVVGCSLEHGSADSVQTKEPTDDWREKSLAITRSGAARLAAALAHEGRQNCYPPKQLPASLASVLASLSSQHPPFFYFLSMSTSLRPVRTTLACDTERGMT